MFRSKRSNLVKKLCKLTSEENERRHSMDNFSYQEHITNDIRTAVNLMLKKLKENQLENLVKSIECHGAEVAKCVLVPRQEVHVNNRSISPHVLCCQLWRRWTDVTDESELRPLHWCNSSSDPFFVCINPYHWSRVSKPG